MYSNSESLFIIRKVKKYQDFGDGNVLREMRANDNKVMRV